MLSILYTLNILLIFFWTVKRLFFTFWCVKLYKYSMCMFWTMLTLWLTETRAGGTDHGHMWAVSTRDVQLQQTHEEWPPRLYGYAHSLQTWCYQLQMIIILCNHEESLISDGVLACFYSLIHISKIRNHNIICYKQCSLNSCTGTSWRKNFSGPLKRKFFFFLANKITLLPWISNNILLMYLSIKFLYNT